MLRASSSPIPSSFIDHETLSAKLAIPSGRDLQLLVVEDDPVVREVCVAIARDIGFEAKAVSSISAANTVLRKSGIDVVLLDIRLGTENGLVLLDELRVRFPGVAVIVMTAFATVGSAILALRSGAFDYIQKPFSVDELTLALASAAHRPLFDAEADNVRAQLRSDHSLAPLADHSPAMEKISRILSRIALATHPVLIVGEPGTGKELVARSIHLNGPSVQGDFVRVDCRSMSPDEIETTLFGTSEDPKTGALSAIPGGTVFLDEIGDLSPVIQAKLERTLEEKRWCSSKSDEAISVAARILASSTCKLDELVKAGRFRRDLFFRLNIVNLQLPPLRDRKSDIPLLSAHILNRIASESNRKYTLGKTAIRLLMEYDWPGNIRELEHAIEYACVVSSGAELHLCDFPEQIQDQHRDSSTTFSELGEEIDLGARENDEEGGLVPSVVLSMAEIEKRAILNTLRQVNGDRVLAAQLLGIGKTTLYRKLKEYGIARDDLH